MCLLTVNICARGLGVAVFHDRKDFVGWVTRYQKQDWEVAGQNFYHYEVAHSWPDQQHFADEASAVQALYEAWSKIPHHKKHQLTMTQEEMDEYF